MSTKLLKIAIALMILLGILFFAREKLYFSWTIWWFDPMMHFLSGGFIGIVVFLIAQKFFSMEINSLKVILIAVASAFIIGIIWEMHELDVGHTSLSDGVFFAFDTASDLIMDVCGGFFGALYARKCLPKYNEQ